MSMEIGKKATALLVRAICGRHISEDEALETIAGLASVDDQVLLDMMPKALAILASEVHERSGLDPNTEHLLRDPEEWLKELMP
jgi:hypothetical protein